MKKIPKKYCYSPYKENGGRFRKISEIGKTIRDTPLDEIMCPNCGAKLIVINYSNSVCEKYVVGCTGCDWEVPFGEIGDYGEAKCQLNEWLEAYYLLGKPKKHITENLTLLFYPEVLSEEYNKTCKNAPFCFDKCRECEGTHADMVRCGAAFSDAVRKEFLDEFSGKNKCKKDLPETIPEYNEFYKKVQTAESFLTTLDHTADKLGDNVKEQLGIIGWNKDTRRLLGAALSKYKEDAKENARKGKKL